MKIDNKCVIAVLESVEEATTYYDPFRYSPVDESTKRLKNYNHDQIIYHIQYCDKEGYFERCSIMNNGAMIEISDLSHAGHAYLQEVRDGSLFAQIKQAFETSKRESIKKLPGMILKILWTKAKIFFGII